MLNLNKKSKNNQIDNFPRHHNEDYDGDDLFTIMGDVKNDDNADDEWNKKAENNKLANFPDLGQFLPHGLLQKVTPQNYLKHDEVQYDPLGYQDYKNVGKKNS